MARLRTYPVHWRDARTHVHPNPERTARVGRIPGTEDYLFFMVYPTREAMLKAYYAHGPECVSAPHYCVKPIQGN